MCVLPFSFHFCTYGLRITFCVVRAKISFTVWWNCQTVFWDLNLKSVDSGRAGQSVCVCGEHTCMFISNSPVSWYPFSGLAFPFLSSKPWDTALTPCEWVSSNELNTQVTFTLLYRWGKRTLGNSWVSHSSFWKLQLGHCLAFLTVSYPEFLLPGRWTLFPSVCLLASLLELCLSRQMLSSPRPVLCFCILSLSPLQTLSIQS